MYFDLGKKQWDNDNVNKYVYSLLFFFQTRVLPVDWDHFHVLLTGLLHRVPSMSSAVLERLTNGPEAFLPDGEWILGQAPEVSCCGR